MALSDKEIVQRVIAGELDKYELIVNRYQAKLKRYITRLTNRPEEVDDILQDVFIKVYKNLRQYNSKLKFSSWIYRICHNESINLIKSSWIQKITSIDYIFNLGYSDNTEEALDKQALKAQINLCLDKLAVKYKEPLVLHYYEDKSYEEISDILRIPIKTVGVLIFRARKQVKKLCHQI